LQYRVYRNHQNQTVYIFEKSIRKSIKIANTFSKTICRSAVFCKTARKSVDFAGSLVVSSGIPLENRLTRTVCRRRRQGGL
jgi:hypothetical protein